MKVCESFNPLGGGAGSGSSALARYYDVDVTLFQSPRRWGGVGLMGTMATDLTVAKMSFNPLGGGAGSGSKQIALQVVKGSGKHVSIPSEVGRGRAPRLAQDKG